MRQRLESLAMSGVTELPRMHSDRRSTNTVSPVVQEVKESHAVVKKSSLQKTETNTATTSSCELKRSQLEVLDQQVRECRTCSELASARTNTVFGSGNPAARICFFGEAPGAEEDATGQPFVGRAGQLLTKIIESCTLSREDIYILNVLKCRPPGNRPPDSKEIGNCRSYFLRQLEIISPEFICCLGTTAAQSLLETQETIGKLRGRWFTHGTAHVICTYHPSYLLRNPSAKRHVWDDMKLLMQRLGVEL